MFTTLNVCNPTQMPPAAMRVTPTLLVLIVQDIQELQATHSLEDRNDRNVDRREPTSRWNTRTPKPLSTGDSNNPYCDSLLSVDRIK